ncbi:MAG: hypothetical protein COA60_002675 [Robiginitomaculum sp.]|nr:hypothetical protein [Robiginitomaculum sp.]
MRFNLILSTGLLFLAASGSAFAAEDKQTPSSLKDIYACMEIAVDSERLSCFDAAAQQVKTAEASGEILAINSGSVRKLKREAFGFDLPSLSIFRLPSFPKLQSGSNDLALVSNEQDGAEVIAKNKEGAITKVKLVIKRYKLRNNGKYRFYLDNGQVWEQSNSGSVFIPKSAPQLIAEIRRAAMGSYLMQINGRGKAIRVRRVS